MQSIRAANDLLVQPGLAIDEIAMPEQVDVMIEVIRDVNPGMQRSEAARRALLCLERLWDSGYLIVTSSTLLGGRFRLAGVTGVAALLLGASIGVVLE